MKIIHPQTGKQALTLEDAVAGLKLAREKFDAAHSEAEAARRAETNTLNDLNNAQKAFDAAVGDVRSDAPWNSDWHRKAKPTHEVAA